MEIEAFEALEEPAHRRARRGFANLIGDGLARRLQPLADTQFSEFVDQQTQHHDEGDGHDALRLVGRRVSRLTRPPSKPCLRLSMHTAPQSYGPLSCWYLH